MATTSEIQVTEAYIGLLGRAPDPTGLAYWTAQLDDAIAAGQSASDALKKLTNDITLSAEWDSGIGANDASTQAGAEAVVTAMYNNLFDRAATATDLAYWSAELVNGTTTASEMAVQLIVAAQANTTNTTDAEVLGYKQQAATYYVETVPQDSFTKASATDSVSAVNGPVTLAASKTATDYVASGVGEAYSLTVAANDVLTGTAGSDTFTGISGTGATVQAGDSVTDTSTVDADVLNITGDDEFDMPTVSGVETINVSIGKQLGAGLDMDAANATGGTINYTVAETVTIAGVVVPGETVLSVDNLSSNLSTVNVTSLNVTADGEAVTVSTDADATAITFNDVNSNDQALIVGNDSGATINVHAANGSATNDSISITANGNVTLDVDGAVAADNDEDVENLTLSGGTNDVDFAISGANDATAMDYITTGSKTVTLSGAADQFSGATFVQGATTALDITGAGALNLTGQGVISGGIDLSADMNTNTVTVQSGNSVTISLDQTAAGVLTLAAANDTTADTLSITLQNDAQDLTTTNFETVTVATGDFAAKIDQITMTDNNADVSIAGSNDITITTDADAGSLAVSGLDVSMGAGLVTSTKGDIDLDAADTLTVAAGLTANNGLTIDADEYNVTGTITVTNGNATLTGTNDSDVDAVTVSAGSLTMSANDIEIGGAVAAQNDISITAGAVVTAGGNTINTTGAGGSNSISITAAQIASSGAIGSATTKTITLATSGTGVNDINGNITTALTSGNSITLSDGNYALGGGSIATNALVITGDTTISQAAAGTTAESITITSTNDVALGTVAEVTDTEGVVLSAGSATGDISATFNGDGGSGQLSVVTGSGNDTIVANEVGKFVVNTGDGVDNLTITNAAAGSSFELGGGADVIDNDETVAMVINAGAGNDSYTPVAGDATVVDMGADYDTVTMGAAKTGAGTIANYEKLVLTAASSMSAAQFAVDNTFQATGAFALTVTGAAATSGVTIDASGVTFDLGAITTMTLTGSGFDDTITGSLSNDTIDGGNGNDTITVTEGTNSLAGGAGNDTITGGNDLDTLIGGAGVDTINGGAGNDAYSFVNVSTAADRDVANGFVVGTDHIILEADNTTDGTAAGAQAVVEDEATAAANANNTVYDLDAALAATTATVDVVTLDTAVLTNLANADLSAATDGDELLKALVVAGAGNTASGINVNGANDKLYVLTDDGVNGYLYLLSDTDGDGIVQEDEIVLIASFSAALVDGIVATGLVMG